MKHEGITYLGGPGATDPEKVCALINSIFYFVGSVFITDNGKNYQLVAHHNGRILINKPYRTLRGAKIAFSKLFGYRSWREDVKAEWSNFYDADGNWIEVRTNN